MARVTFGGGGHSEGEEEETLLGATLMLPTSVSLVGLRQEVAFPRTGQAQPRRLPTVLTPEMLTNLLQTLVGEALPGPSCEAGGIPPEELTGDGSSFCQPETSIMTAMETLYANRWW